MLPLWLSLACLATALVYASVGLGGGSTYAALLALADLETESLRVAVLSMNVVVAGVGHIAFQRAGHLRRPLLLPFLLTSLPAAFLGGWLRVPSDIFSVLLAGMLVLVGARMLLGPSQGTGRATVPRGLVWTVGLCVGGILGFLAGLTGIGGGVLLGPVLLMLGWATSQEASAISAVFVWANSASGLAAHLLRGNFPDSWLWPLLGIVFVGGLVGARFGARKLSASTVQRVFGFVVVGTAVRLLWRAMQ